MYRLESRQVTEGVPGSVGPSDVCLSPSSVKVDLSRAFDRWVRGVRSGVPMATSSVSASAAWAPVLTDADAEETGAAPSPKVEYDSLSCFLRLSELACLPPHYSRGYLQC